MEILKKRDEIIELDKLIKAKKAEIKAEQAKLVQISESEIKDKLQDEIEQLSLKLKKETDEYFEQENNNKIKLNSITKECNKKHNELKDINQEYKLTIGRLINRTKEINEKIKQANKILMTTEDDTSSLKIKNKELLKEITELKKELKQKTLKNSNLEKIVSKNKEKVEDSKKQRVQSESEQLTSKKNLDEINEEIRVGAEKIEKQKYVLLTLLAREEKVNDMAKRIKKHYLKAGITINDL